MKVKPTETAIVNGRKIGAGQDDGKREVKKVDKTIKKGDE